MGKKQTSPDAGDGATFTIEERVEMALSGLRPRQQAAVRKVIRQLRAGAPVDTTLLPNGRYEFAEPAPNLALVLQRQGSAVRVVDLLHKEALVSLASS